MPFLSHPLTERSEDGGREERDEQRIGEAKRRRDEVRHGPTADPRSLRSLVPLPPTGRAGEPSGRMGWVRKGDGEACKGGTGETPNPETTELII